MTSTITITPVTNLTDHDVIDDKLVEVKKYDSDMDIFVVENISGKRRKCNLMNISLYDDLLIIDGVKHKVLGMLSRR